MRGAAVRALASVKGQEAAALMRPYLDDPDPALVVTAASALSNSADPADVAAAADAFRALVDDSREQRAATRAEVARALGRVANPAFRPLLVPLMFDADIDVARDAIKSAARLGGGDYLFVAPLVSLLRHRLLKGAARDVLAGYGEDVVPTLVYFMRDRDEDLWVRRHMPATLARIPCAATLQALRGCPRRSRRLPALQGALGARAPAPHPAGHDRAAGHASTGWSRPKRRGPSTG